jgi:surface polysaccharide O-acyltransferase-like enzyme
MNATGLNIIKTLGCMTAVTFFTIYNTWDHYDYDYHWILGFLTFISTIATPLFLWSRAISTASPGTAPAGSWARLKAW